jgi:hypothetical protein
MSNLLPQHSNLQLPDCDGTPTPALEALPAPDGVGRAQRSEPERSDGERSGARPHDHGPSPPPGGTAYAAPARLTSAPPRRLTPG